MAQDFDIYSFDWVPDIDWDSPERRHLRAQFDCIDALNAYWVQVAAGSLDPDVTPEPDCQCLGPHDAPYVPNVPEGKPTAVDQFGCPHGDPTAIVAGF